MVIKSFDEPIRKDRTQHGGGVLVYLFNPLKYKRCLVLESQRLETMWVEIKFPSLNILICCLYRSDRRHTNFDRNGIRLQITGDINIDFTNVTNVQLRNCLVLFNLTNIIKEPKRVVGNSKTLTDPVIVSDACPVLDPGTITVEPLKSDQKATYVSIKSSVLFTESYYRDVWNYKQADFEKN